MDGGHGFPRFMGYIWVGIFFRSVNSFMWPLLECGSIPPLSEGVQIRRVLFGDNAHRYGDAG